MAKSKAIQELEHFFSNFPLKEFKKGENVLEVDQTLSSCLYLIEGFVRQFSVSQKGEDFTLTVFKPDSFFPLNLVLHRETNPYYFKALTDVSVRLAPKDKVISFLKSNPQILFDLFYRVTSGVNGLLFRMESLIFGTAQQKVAAAIYFNASRFGTKSTDKNHNKIDFPLTHQQIASLTGLTRETVSLEMMELKKKKLINYQAQQISVLALAELKEASSVPFYQ